jgi:hypothetical protein
MIKLTEKQVKDIYNGKKVKGYEGYSIEYDDSTGDFDSEKGAMTDFEIYLYNEEEDLVGTAIGGYYTGVGGISFSYDLEFEAPEPETDLTRFNEYLRNTSYASNLSGNDLAIISSKLKNITEYVNKLAKTK